MSTSDTAVGDEAETVEQAPEPGKPTRWLVTISVLAVILVGALVVGGIMLRSVLDYRAAAERRDAIMSVAREVAQVSYSLDYKSFREQVSSLADKTTGEYRKGLLDSANGLAHLLSEGKVESKGTITAAGIEREDGNTATVLFSITAHVTNTEIRMPQARHYRVAIGLVRQGSEWFVQSNDVIA